MCCVRVHVCACACMRVCACVCVCDNWHEVSLLDVTGKLLGRILQKRLQLIAESMLPDSQWISARA